VFENLQAVETALGTCRNPSKPSIFLCSAVRRKAQAHGKAFGFGHENSMYQIHRGRYSLHVTRQVTIVRVSIAPNQGGAAAMNIFI
jgi:hypothetical protein